MPNHQHALYIVAISILTYGFYLQRCAISELRAEGDAAEVAQRAVELQLTLQNSEQVAASAKHEIFSTITNATDKLLMDGMRKLDQRVDAIESGGYVPPPLPPELFDDVPPLPPLTPEMMERLLRGLPQFDDPSKEGFTL